MKPLDSPQVCPLFFLWIEKAVVMILGFSELTLRLVPHWRRSAVCSCFATSRAGWFVGRGWSCRWRSWRWGYAPVRHGGEVKPYASDFLMALALLALAVEWVRTPWRVRFLWGLAALGPIALGFSHPAIFVAGSVGIVLLLPVLKTRSASTYVPFALFGLGTLFTFACLLKFVNQSQSESVMEVMSAYWAGAFPPRNSPICSSGSPRSTPATCSPIRRAAIAARAP